MTRKPPETQFENRMKRASAFCEVLVVSLLIQAILNLIFEKLGVQLRLAVYETALIWMFCK
jgi:hypothetical protein